MKIEFKTNIDAYKGDTFPSNLTHVPRIGEKILVIRAKSEYYTNKKLPLKLEVVDVTYTEAGIVCELHYNKNDLNPF